MTGARCPPSPRPRSSHAPPRNNTGSMPVHPLPCGAAASSRRSIQEQRSGQQGPTPSLQRAQHPPASWLECPAATPPRPASTPVSNNSMPRPFSGWHSEHRSWRPHGCLRCWSGRVWGAHRHDPCESPATSSTPPLPRLHACQHHLTLLNGLLDLDFLRLLLALAFPGRPDQLLARELEVEYLIQQLVVCRGEHGCRSGNRNQNSCKKSQVLGVAVAKIRAPMLDAVSVCRRGRVARSPWGMGGRVARVNMPSPKPRAHASWLLAANLSCRCPPCHRLHF